MSQYFENIYYTVKSVLSGMSLTWEHFINKKKYVSTLQYPNEKWPQPERNIGFDHSEYNEIRSRLHVDIDDCIGCLQCERACPVDCIKIDTVKPSKDSNHDCGKTSNDTQKKFEIGRFSIDMSECMYCNLCVYPCPEECIFMVGGPNEPKHEIDYEFSKYVKHDLVFEFANVSNDDLINIGAQDYVNKRTEVANKILNANDLKGGTLDEAKSNDNKTDSSSKRKISVDPGFLMFNTIKDKVARGLAKKSYAYGRRKNLDMNGLSKYVEDALNSNNKMTPDVVTAIKSIIDYKYPDDSNQLPENDSQVEETSKAPASELFDMKKLNDLTDKVARGTAKKIFIKGKKNNESSNQIIDQIISAFEDGGLLNDDSKIILDNLKSSNESTDTPAKEAAIETVDTKALFSIKELNVIEDKVARGTAKKIYLSGKKSDKSANDIIDEISNKLKDLDKMNDDIENLLKGLLG